MITNNWLNFYEAIQWTIKMISIYSRWFCTKCKKSFLLPFHSKHDLIKRHMHCQHVRFLLIHKNEIYPSAFIRLLKYVAITIFAPQQITRGVLREKQMHSFFFDIVKRIRCKLKEKQWHGLSCKYSTINWCPNYEITYQSNTFECVC